MRVPHNASLAPQRGALEIDLQASPVLTTGSSEVGMLAALSVAGRLTVPDRPY